MRKVLLLLIILASSSLSAQLGKAELGDYCGDDHASPSRQIQKGLQALNKGDYPNAGVYIGAALRQNEADQHALYLRGEWAIKRDFHLSPLTGITSAALTSRPLLG